MGPGMPEGAHYAQGGWNAARLAKRPAMLGGAVWMSLPGISAGQFWFGIAGVVLLYLGLLVHGSDGLKVAGALLGLLVLVADAVSVFAMAPTITPEEPLVQIPQHQVYAPLSTSERIRVVFEGPMHAAAFAPSYFLLPAHRYVTVTILSTDMRPSPPAPYYTKVQGTVGGSIYVNGRRIQTVPPEDVAHTFTAPALGLNVPIPVATKGHAVTVRFTLQTPAKGTYEWLCVCPCGIASPWAYPMMQPDLMEGDIRVV